MSDPAGGFRSASDADSPGPDGHDEEGRFFTWTPGELRQVFGARRARIAAEPHLLGQAQLQLVLQFQEVRHGSVHLELV